MHSKNYRLFLFSADTTAAFAALFGTIVDFQTYQRVSG